MANFKSYVTFPSGSCREKSTVTAIAQHGEDFIIMTEATPFHPRNYQWPDQPQDKGYIENSEGKRYTLSDVVYVGISPNGVFSIDTEIPVKKTDPAWHFCVGHVVAGEKPSFAQGDKIILQVDEDHRSKLSRTHSATHIMALALNRTLAPLWQKEALHSDSLGSPNFDQIAMDTSAIGLLTSKDQYRIGKSLRKKGFAAGQLSENLKKHEDAVNARINGWMQENTPITQRVEGNDITSYIYWCTRLEDTDIETPCGGTHVKSFGDIGNIHVELEMFGDETLIVTTSVK